jgi:hypothetical protein
LVSFHHVPKRLRVCPRKSNTAARLVDNGHHQPLKRQTRLMETMVENLILVLALNILVASLYLGAKWFGTEGSWWPQ